MRYTIVLIFCMLYGISRAGDTIYVEDAKDPRLLRYQDTMKAYNIGYSVAKNVADSVRRIVGDNTFTPYFLSRYMTGKDGFSASYFYTFVENEPVEIGHVNSNYHGMKSDARFPWKYLETQYKRLDSINVLPWGVTFQHSGIRSLEFT